jgi:serine phosphatase RsbU (regulator of sigma subunit)
MLEVPAGTLTLEETVSRWGGRTALARLFTQRRWRLSFFDPAGVAVAAWNCDAAKLRCRPDGAGQLVVTESGAERPARLRAISAYGQLLGHMAVIWAEGEMGSDGAMGEAIAACLEEHARNLLEIESLSHDLLECYEEVNFLYGLSETLGGVAGVEEICELVVEKTSALIPVRRAAIWLMDERRGALVRLGPRKLDPGEAFAPSGPVVGRVLSGLKSLLVDEPEAFPPELQREIAAAGGGGLLCVPLTLRARGVERCVGAFLLLDKEAGRFSSADLKLMQAIAGQVAGLVHMLSLLELKRDMSAAREIQRVLLPTATPRVADAEVAGRCRPSQQIGGDYYDHVVDARGRLTVLVADVSGHDLASALFMAQARVVFKDAMRREAAPAELLQRANEALAPDLLAAGLFISVFVARYDPGSRMLEYACAGHNPPLVRRGKTGRCDSLRAEGFLIGVAESSRYQERRTRLEPGDVLVLYTDGLVEARDAAGAFFGLERLKALVQGTASRPGEPLLDRIYREVETFAGATPLSDDVTVVVLRANARGGKGAKP